KDQLSHMNTVWHLTSSDEPGSVEFAKKIFNVVKNNSFDIVHAHGFTSAILLSFFIPFIGGSSIFTSHDVLNERQLCGTKGRLKKIIMQIALNRYKTIHSVSKDAEENLLSTRPGIKKEKSLVIFNGVDTDRFFSAKPFPLRGYLGLSENAVIVGFFGRFM